VVEVEEGEEHEEEEEDERWSGGVNMEEV